MRKMKSARAQQKNLRVATSQRAVHRLKEDGQKGGLESHNGDRLAGTVVTKSAGHTLSRHYNVTACKGMMNSSLFRLLYPTFKENISRPNVIST